MKCLGVWLCLVMGVFHPTLTGQEVNKNFSMSPIEETKTVEPSKKKFSLFKNLFKRKDSEKKEESSVPKSPELKEKEPEQLSMSPEVEVKDLETITTPDFDKDLDNFEPSSEDHSKISDDRQPSLEGFQFKGESGAYQYKRSLVDLTEPKEPSYQALDYRLKPGDKIEISVWGENMTRELMVRPDGKISYILIDEIDVVGKTFKQLKDEIELKLSQFILEPKVSIIGKSFEGNFVSILGAVAKPGRQVVSNSDHVLDVLTKAGGLKFIEFGNSNKVGEVANLRNAYLSRSGQLVPVDFVKLLYEGDMRHNIPVQIGDFIYIPSTVDMPIYITGEFNNPSSLPYVGQPTLLEAIAEGRGFNIKANKKKVFVVRGGMVKPEMITYNYHDIISGRLVNPTLEPGDIVYVPPTTLTKIERLSSQIIPFLNSIIDAKTAKSSIQNW